MYNICYSNWNHVHFFCVGVQRVRQLQRPVRVPQDVVRTSVPRASIIVADHFKLRTADETHWTSSGFRSRYLLQEQVQPGLLHPVPSGSVSSSYLVSFVILKRGALITSQKYDLCHTLIQLSVLSQQILNHDK